MKAWSLDINNDPDQGVFVVFANTRNEARGRASGCDLMYDSWLDVRAVRFKAMDDKEKLDPAHLHLDLWRNHGWTWIDSAIDDPDPENTTDEKFIKWYEETF